MALAPPVRISPRPISHANENFNKYTTKITNQQADYNTVKTIVDLSHGNMDLAEKALHESLAHLGHFTNTALSTNKDLIA